MSKYKKKGVVIEAITFDELVKHGIESGAPLTNGMPWSFDYKGQPITHENDECYLIPTLEGTMNMTPDDMLITGIKGEVYPCKVDIFNESYIEDLFVNDPVFTHERDVKCNKQLRVNLDGELQNLKSLPKSRERSLVITKLQEAIMWLGMDLKRLNEPNPYPNSYNPNNTDIAPTADGIKM